jgi:hypothetical protein
LPDSSHLESKSSHLELSRCLDCLVRKKYTVVPTTPLTEDTGLPYAGRFWDVPAEGVKAAWHFGALHKKYGPIYEWKVMGTIHIWVENDKIARDLFVTRQKKYCDRNVLPAAVKVKYGSELLPLMGYGDAFRRYKNFMHMIMRQSNPKQFYGWPVIENKKTLRRLIETPEQWSEHLIVHCEYLSIPLGGNDILTRM